MFLFLSCLASFSFHFPCLFLATSHMLLSLSRTSETTTSDYIWLLGFRHWEALDVSVRAENQKKQVLQAFRARFKVSASWCTEPASGTPQLESHKRTGSGRARSGRQLIGIPSESWRIHKNPQESTTKTILIGLNWIELAYHWVNSLSKVWVGIWSADL
jgi:hypothetical protein